jgi:hypothetical protein
MAGVTGCADPKHRIDRNLMPSGRKPFSVCGRSRDASRTQIEYNFQMGILY